MTRWTLASSRTPRHADGLAYALFLVDQEFLRQHVQHLLVRRNRQRPRGVDHPVHVRLRDLLVADRNDAVRVVALYVATGDARVDVIDLAAGHQLRLLHGAADGFDGGVDVHHHAALEAAGGAGADADDFDGVLGRHGADDGGDLGCADIQTDDQIPIFTLATHRSFTSSSGCRAARRRGAASPPRIRSRNASPRG